jgi:hypothetical protein
MPNLRDMIDGMTVTAAGIAPPMADPAAPPPGNAGQPKSKLPQPGGKVGKPGQSGKPGKGGKSQGSPLAQHIGNHMQDPLGATKEGFGKLTQAKLEYDQQREEMQRNLAPVQSVMDHVSQIHGIMPGTPAGQVPTPGMTPPQQPGQIDPATGQPMDPAMAGQDPNNPGGNDDPDMQNGVPQNMNQTPGQMNQNRPSMAGHQPGVSPGPAQSVVPGKMGMPKPGGGKSPMPGQVNKPAAKPKGAGSMPGAKGPGDPKVAGKTKKAQGQSGRQIKINVAASNAVDMIHASRTMETQFGIATLLAAGTSDGAKKHWSVRNKGPLSKKEKQAHYKTMESMQMRPSGGGRSGARVGGGMPSGGGNRGPARPVSGRLFSKKRVKAGPEALNDKVNDPGAEVAYNPKYAAAGKHMKGCGCSKCKGM